MQHPHSIKQHGAKQLVNRLLFAGIAVNDLAATPGAPKVHTVIVAQLAKRLIRFCRDFRHSAESDARASQSPGRARDRLTMNCSEDANGLQAGAGKWGLPIYDKKYGFLVVRSRQPSC